MRHATLFLLLVTWTWQAAFASPPARPDVPQAVDAYLVFPAGREPDARGRFEIEVYCGANFPVGEIALSLARSGEVMLDATEAFTAIDERTLRLFSGSMAQGESKVWRFRGRLPQPATGGEEQEKGLPAGLVLYVEYLYPRQAVVRQIEQMDASAWERDALRRGIESTDARRSLVRALPVARGGRLR